MIQDLIRKCNKSSEIWNIFEQTYPEKAMKFKTFFHLRPCGAYITIVTTHSDFPMRGVRCGIRELPLALEVIAQAVRGSSVHWQHIAAAKETWNFDKRTAASVQKKEEPEFAAQAEIINQISGGKYPLAFVASELILHEGREGRRDRIDIVAHDHNGKVFFIEVKAEDNTRDNPEEQIKRYIEKYSNNRQFEQLLSGYPIYPVKRIAGYIGKIARGTELSDI